MLASLFFFDPGDSGLHFRDGIFGIFLFPDSWIHVEDRFGGKRFTCSGYRLKTCGLWLYLNTHEERLFYGSQRPDYERLLETPLRGKAVQVWYICTRLGRCAPVQMIVEGLGPIVSFEQSEQELRTTILYRFLFAGVTLIPGMIFSIIAYRRFFHPPPPSSLLGPSEIGRYPS